MPKAESKFKAFTFILLYSISFFINTECIKTKKFTVIITVNFYAE